MLLKMNETKALTKSEGPNICWDAGFFNPFLQQTVDANLKNDPRNEHPNNHLALLVLTEV